MAITNKANHSGSIRRMGVSDTHQLIITSQHRNASHAGTTSSPIIQAEAWSRARENNQAAMRWRAHRARSDK